MTRRETEVVRLVAQGQTDDSIAATLTIGIGVVRSYLCRARQKIGIVRCTRRASPAMRVRVAAWAWKQGIVDIEDVLLFEEKQ
ncbi:MAG: hypothetical protein AUH05_05190 [Ktedonobacter sp. 13_2_20CM_53_11]|nr:MAG: hypothetical protein AUH05_05190 [Ktedonobacter sp. 13_2_20CM_53_11]